MLTPLSDAAVGWLARGSFVEWIDAWSRGLDEDASQLDVASLVPLLRLARLGVLVDAFRGAVLDSFELTPREFDVLSALRAVGRPYSMNPSQLYAPLRLSSGGTTKILKRLVGAGHIARDPNPEDGRSVRVSLTSRGVAFHDRVMRAIAAAATRAFAGLSEAEKIEIDGALRRIQASLDDV
jgi:DNA-binding MarR family transcriptional regulator